ncbi:MAG: MoaD/ThiS family protein [Candidatus Hydrothermarchaeota archaeon]|jgi:sulfur carrier protein|nr:MoaD/ThiS family protein [Candidatus Hydrothermarchaeota archaeon]
MRIKLVLDGKERTIKAGSSSTVMHLLQSLGINRETVLVRKNGEICVEEEKIKEGDDIEIIKTISGG